MNGKALYTKQQIIKLLIPLIIEQVLTSMVGIVDTIMVSNVGEATVSGVSLIDSVNMLILSIFTALATGGAIVAAQYIGRREEDNARRAACQLVYITVSLGVLTGAVCVFFRGGIIANVYPGLEPEVFSSAMDYFLVTAVSFPFIAQYLTCGAVFRAMNHSTEPMIVSGVVNVINIIGNAVLIFGFGLGALGAGLATLFSRFAGCVILTVMLRSDKRQLSIRGVFPIRLEPLAIKNILTIGIPTGLENGLFQLGKVLVAGIVAAFGTSAIAANTISTSLSSICVMPGGAIGLGLLTIVGQCVGAGEYKQAKSYAIRLTALGHAFTIVIAAAIIALTPLIIKLYNLEGDTAQMARTLIIIGSVLPAVLWAPAFILPNCLRAASDVRFTMLVSVISMFTMRVGMGYVFSTLLGYGVYGIWIGMTMDWIVRLSFFGGRFLKGSWTKRKILQ